MFVERKSFLSQHSQVKFVANKSVFFSILSVMFAFLNQLVKIASKVINISQGRGGASLVMQMNQSEQEASEPIRTGCKWTNQSLESRQTWWVGVDELLAEMTCHVLMS